MRDLLKTHFGFDGFLPLQEEIIGSVMDGKDAFVLMPTGGGKSLCYQLPALALDGLTLVISPLISLMKDQVDALKTNGINAEFINSSLDQREVAEVGERAHRGDIKILYVAPERAVLPGFQGFLKTLKRQPHRHRRGPLRLRVGARVPPRVPGALWPTRGLSESSGHRSNRNRNQAGKRGRPLPVGPPRAADFRVQFRQAEPDLFRGTKDRCFLRAVGAG